MPRPLVIDASFAFRLLVAGPQQARLGSLVAAWLREGCELYAPALWVYEITSALSKLVRLSELTSHEGGRSLALALAFPVRLIPPDGDQARSAYAWTRRLNRGAAYDSF